MQTLADDPLDVYRRSQGMAPSKHGQATWHQLGDDASQLDDVRLAQVIESLNENRWHGDLDVPDAIKVIQNVDYAKQQGEEARSRLEKYMESKGQTISEKQLEEYADIVERNELLVRKVQNMLLSDVVANKDAGTEDYRDTLIREAIDRIDASREAYHSPKRIAPSMDAARDDAVFHIRRLWHLEQALEKAKPYKTVTPEENAAAAAALLQAVADTRAEAATAAAAEAAAAEATLDFEFWKKMHPPPSPPPLPPPPTSPTKRQQQIQRSVREEIRGGRIWRGSTEYPAITDETPEQLQTRLHLHKYADEDDMKKLIQPLAWPQKQKRRGQMVRTICKQEWHDYR